MFIAVVVPELIKWRIPGKIGRLVANGIWIVALLVFVVALDGSDYFPGNEWKYAGALLVGAISGGLLVQAVKKWQVAKLEVEDRE